MMPASRHVVVVRHDGGNAYSVRVEEGASATTHVVTVWPSDLERYAPDAEPEQLVEASFRFLLTREPKESILRRFDLAVVERYFPEFPSRIAEFLSGG
jgi:hypothetical protein